MTFDANDYQGGETTVPATPSSVTWRDPATWTPGQRFGDGGRFELGSLLGRGGAGIVYSVYDHRLRRRVAAKLSLHPPDPSAPDPLEAEARVTGQLHHPNIVQVYDCVTWDGNSCVLMEQVTAPTLQTLVTEDKLTLQQTLHVLVQVVDALHHAHSRGILHLDIKPSNLFITRLGQVKLFDFGVGARLAMGYDQAHESFVVGTPGYMAPEQWAFESLDARADVWAVGMLLHEVIFGHTAAKVPLGYSSLRCRTRWDTTGFSPSLRHIFAATLTMNPLDRAPQVTDLAIPLRQAAVELCEHQFGKLSPDERLVAAACSLLSLRSELTKRSLSTLKRITELSELAVERAWDGLVRRTIISAGDAPHWGAGDCLMQACFAALPEDERVVIALRVASDNTRRIAIAPRAGVIRPEVGGAPRNVPQRVNGAESVRLNNRPTDNRPTYNTIQR